MVLLKDWLRAVSVALVTVALIFNLAALSGHLQIQDRHFITISNSLTLLIVGLSLAWGSLALATKGSEIRGVEKRDRLVALFLGTVALVWLVASFFNWWDAPWWH